MTPYLLILASGAEAAGKSGLPQMDASTYPSQLFWLAVSFLVLYLAMDQIFLKKLGGIIEERRNRLADDYDQAEEFKNQAADAEKSYLQSLADAKAKAATIAADTRASLDKEIAVMQAETEEKLAEKLQAAEASISEMQTQAATRVKEAAVETTQALVEALIDEKPTPETVNNAISALN